MPQSLFERMFKCRAQKKQLSEQKRQELLDLVLQNKIRTAERREFYMIRAKESIERARRAVQSRNEADKQIAMRELKVNYAFYHYMSSLYNAFNAIESQMQMQTATEEFVEIATRLAGIKVQGKNVNFAELTRKALKGFKPVDTTGLDKMVDDLIRGSITATESDSADDAFLEALISGQSTLDTPFPSETLLEHDANESAAEENHEDIMALLDKVAEGLKD